MEIPRQDFGGINYYGNIEIQGGNGCANQQNDLHVSVIKPITKKIIHCTDPKVTAFYKPTELVEEVTTYISPEDKHLLQMYKDIKEKEKKNKQSAQAIETDAEKKGGAKLSKKKSIFNRFNFRNIAKRNEIYKRTNGLKKTSTVPVPFSATTSLPPSKLFKEDKNLIPQIETVFIPKFEKNVEIISHLKENLNVDYTYMIPKPIVIPVEVPVLKFKDNFQIVPIRKKIIPVLKYTNEIIYVDCYIEKPYLVTENIVVPIACDAPIQMRTYLDKAPPVVSEDSIHSKDDKQDERVNETMEEQLDGYEDEKQNEHDEEN